VRVTVGGILLRFRVPARLRPGGAALRAATRAFDAAPALTIVERLSSQPGNLQVTVFHERAPDRLGYRIVSSTQPGVAGTAGVVVGARRWDRAAGTPWQASAQAPLRLPRTSWGARAGNVFLSGRGRLTFYDPQYRAWYRLRLDRAGRPAELEMVAAAHFMHHAYSFRSPVISPPAR
jgi:hypothetical protein